MSSKSRVEMLYKIIGTGTTLSKSHVIQEENLPLLMDRRNGTSSYNGSVGRGVAHIPIGRNLTKPKWPPKFINANGPSMAMNASVTISDVWRNSTPVATPLPDAKIGVSWVSASFLLINAALGIGILNFPAAYNQAGGIFSATCIQLVMLALIVLTMLILAHCSDVNGDMTYHDVLLSMCGRKAQKLAALSITCTCYGVCVAIFIIIGDQIDRLFLSFFDSNFCHHWYLERHFTIPAISIIFMLPMCYCQRVDFLRFAGSLGIFAMLYPVFLTVYGYAKVDVQPPTIKTHPDNIAQFFAVVPVLCFAYQCQEVVVPVYSCMRERTLTNFAKSCCLAMGFLLLIYSIIGCCGYLTFGALVSPNVMKMYNADDPIVMIGVGALIIKMIVTYPVLVLCGRGAVEGLYAEFRELSAAQFLDGQKRRRILIVSAWFGSSLLLALYTRSIGTVIHILGSVSSANIFIYPGICLMQVVIKKDADLEHWKSWCLLAVAISLAAIGAFCFGVVLFDTLLGDNRNTEGLEILCS